MSDKEMAIEDALDALRVARQTIANWAEDANGRVTIHKDVISKAVEAAIEHLEGI